MQQHNKYTDTTHKVETLKPIKNKIQKKKYE